MPIKARKIGVLMVQKRRNVETVEKTVVKIKKGIFG